MQAAELCGSSDFADLRLVDSAELRLVAEQCFVQAAELCGSSDSAESCLVVDFAESRLVAEPRFVVERRCGRRAPTLPRQKHRPARLAASRFARAVAQPSLHRGRPVRSSAAAAARAAP